MANLDSEAKRMSGIALSCPWRSMWPIPDSILGQGDRPEMAFMYWGWAFVMRVAHCDIDSSEMEVYPLQGSSTALYRIFSSEASKT